MAVSPGTTRVLRFVLGILVLGVVVWVLTSGVLHGLSAEVVRDWLIGSGPWGPILFFTSFALLQPFGFSAHVFILGASLVWPAPIALALSWAGTLAAACVAFWFARFMGGEWVRSRIPKRLDKYNDRLEREGFKTVLVMRLLLFTFGPMQFMFGVSRVAFSRFLPATALGILPLVAVETLVGASALAAWL